MQGTNKNLNSQFTVSLRNKAYNLAKNISKAFPEKEKQIYRNVLGIYTVKSYCDFLGIDTDFPIENSLDLITQTFLNTAPLRLKNLGTLECIPFLSGSNTIKIPRETWENRIGYLAVEIDVSLLKQREISQTQEETLSELADNILYQLNQLWIQQESQETKIIKLSKWFDDIQNIFDVGWQTIEVFRSLYQTELNFATATALRTRNSIVQKPLDKRIAIKYLEKEIQCPVALIATLEQIAEYKYDILLQVTPLENKTSRYLPPHLTLAILDENGNSFMETKAREKDNLIQLQFRGMPQNKFSLVIQFNHFEFKKNFEI